MLGQSKNVFQAEIDAACEFIDFLKFNASYMEEIYKNQHKSTKILKNYKNKNIDVEYTKNTKDQKKITTSKNRGSKFFSYLIVFIISFFALVILLDTLKSPLINVFPVLEVILFSLFETLQMQMAYARNSSKGQCFLLFL